ncbi:IS5 family transposase [Leptospira noguchii]|nr:IS5 family transposase [Leptospira noguchii]UOG34724.1 IS5 family transposase [Leptospira noguchii]UOG45617.1 IS5 family transposase [Leptospira noguchii]
MGIIDSQSVKTIDIKGEKGYDGGKKIKGRKRHIFVDSFGFLIKVIVHAADIQDRDGAKLLLESLNRFCSRLKLIWADGGYSGKLIAWVKETFGYDLEIIKKSDDAKGFKVLPKRWIVERTFGWFNKFRRLSKDYESLPRNSQAMIYIAMISIMARRN